MSITIENCKRQEELFALWKEKQKQDEQYDSVQNSGIPIDSFIDDGIVDTDAFLASPATVVFILKEANIAKNMASGEQFSWYYSLKSDNIPKQKEKMSRMAAYLAYGEKTPSKERLSQTVKSFAFININKRGGGRKANDKELKKYYADYFDFINKQILIFFDKQGSKHKTIVFIGTWKYKKSKDLMSSLREKYDGIDSIDMWHTAYTQIKKEHATINGIDDRNVSKYMNEFFERAKFKKHRMNEL